MSSTLIEPLEKPDKTRCVHCGCSESPTQILRRCGKCRSAPYCSVECQRADWKSHKEVCARYAVGNLLNYTGVHFGERASKPKKGEVKRTRGQIFNDLKLFAETHNGDTLTVSAWHLLGLVKNITRAKTHFLLLTLRRTTSSNPRTVYSLIEASVLPLSVLEEAFSDRGLLQDSSPISPKAILASEEETAKRNGALGSVMVMSIELPHGEDRSPQDALKEMSVHIFQPLGLFKAHKDTLSRLPHKPRDYWMRCLKNALDGGAYSTKFQPYRPPP